MLPNSDKMKNVWEGMSNSILLRLWVYTLLKQPYPGFSGILTRIVGVKGKHDDHLTTTTALVCMLTWLTGAHGFDSNWMMMHLLSTTCTYLCVSVILFNFVHLICFNNPTSIFVEITLRSFIILGPVLLFEYWLYCFRVAWPFKLSFNFLLPLIP